VKPYIFLLIFLIIGGGCGTNRHCCPQQTADNLQAIGAKIADDASLFPERFSQTSYAMFKTSGDAGETFSTFYEAINFSDTGTRMAAFFSFIGGQVDEGTEKTPQNLKTVGQALCLVGE